MLNKISLFVFFKDDGKENDVSRKEEFSSYKDLAARLEYYDNNDDDDLIDVRAYNK